jgi:WD40 repeat protein/serine/threonine protein kinase
MTGPSSTPYPSQTTYYQQLGGQVLEQLEAQAPVEWQVGDVILDLYEIKALLGEGGMGKVFRAHHRGWNIDLAVKCPKPGLFTSQAGKDLYFTEAQTWIELGLHPHIASCYYVRSLGGAPRLFAECVEGGSLESWIESQKLYEGGKAQALERVLDVAIQFAWGLAYAHEQGLVHQDVKPDNVLMTPEGVVKVTDFGLANAVGKGGTPAYCSPEQARGEPLSLKTDIWSWGVSVLEMFTGEVYWKFGEAATEVLEGYLDEGAHVTDTPPMPEDVAKLLQQCFRRNAAERPKNMLEIAGRLQDIYQHEVGQPYPRQLPKAVELRADSLNNKALSLLDLGKDEEAVRTWQKALEIDPHQVEAFYNFGVWRWNHAELTDLELVQQLEAFARTQPGVWMPYFLLGKAHLIRRDLPAARHALEKAASLAPEEPLVLEALQRLEGISPVECLRIIDAEYGIRSVAITPDEHQVFVGGNDITLKVWDLENETCLKTMNGHTNQVNSVAIVPDWTRVAVSGSSDRTVRVWNLITYGCRYTLKGHTHSVNAVAVSMDGRWAASGSDDSTVRIWDLKNGECARILRGHTSLVRAVAITPDGQRAVSGSADKTLRVWNLVNGECLHTLDNYGYVANAVIISSDGQKVLSMSMYDKVIRVWDLNTGVCIMILEGHMGEVFYAAITSDSRYVISGSEDRTLRVWDMTSGVCLRTLEGHTGSVHAVALTSVSHLAVSGSYDKTLRVWQLTSIDQISPEWALNRPLTAQVIQSAAENMQQKLEAARLAINKGNVHQAASIIRQAFLITGFERDPELLSKWHTIGRQAGRPIGLRMVHVHCILQGHTDSVNSVAITRDGHWAISGSADETIRVWDLNNASCLRTLRGHTHVVNSVTLTPDEERVISGSEDYTIRIWDSTRWNCINIINQKNRSVRAFAISSDGRWGVSGSMWEKSVQVWAFLNQKHLCSLIGHSDRIWSVSITPDGQKVISGSNDGTLRVWDLATGKCEHILRGHTSSVLAVASNHHQVISGSNDKTLRVWDLTSGECLGTLYGHSERVGAVVLTPDGRWVISGSDDKTLRVWDLSIGKCSNILEGHKDGICALALTPDGRRVVSGGWDKTLIAWILDWDYEFPVHADWDKGACPYLENFLTLHTPYAGTLPQNREPTEKEITLALTRRGVPAWTEEDFKSLLYTLGCAGYGWLRPEGVRRELERMAKERS